jgi:hypothetical protein
MAFFLVEGVENDLRSISLNAGFLITFQSACTAAPYLGLKDCHSWSLSRFSVVIVYGTTALIISNGSIFLTILFWCC